jgi:hypothetical protein
MRAVADLRRSHVEINGDASPSDIQGEFKLVGSGYRDEAGSKIVILWSGLEFCGACSRRKTTQIGHPDCQNGRTIYSNCNHVNEKYEEEW